MPADLSARVRGGYRTPEDPVFMLGDTIREIDMDGKTTAEWRVWENLSVESEVICPLEGRREWTHANSIHVTSDKVRGLPSELQEHQQRRPGVS